MKLSQGEYYNMIKIDRSHTIKILGDIGIYSMVIGFFGTIIFPSIIGIFSDTYEYIKNSERVMLEPYEYITKEHITYDGSAGKDMFIIKSHNMYYSLNYYRKNKVDYGGIFNFPRNNNRIFITVNKFDIANYQGSYEDPIPVLNFSFDGEKYIWDEESYQYNVERYYVREKILKPKFFYIVHFMIFIGLIIFILTTIHDFKNKKTKTNKP